MVCETGGSAYVFYTYTGMSLRDLEAAALLQMGSGGAPAVARVDDGRAAGRVKDDHGSARAVVGVDKGDAHALHHQWHIQLEHPKSLPWDLGAQLRGAHHSHNSLSGYEDPSFMMQKSFHSGNSKRYLQALVDELGRDQSAIDNPCMGIWG